MMKLRWLIKKYPQPSKEAVLALWNNGKDGLTISKCVDMLSKKDETNLQVGYEVTDMSSGETIEYWTDVPIVVEEVR